LTQRSRAQANNEFGHLPVQQSECSDVGVQPSGDVGCLCAFKSAIAAKILPGSSSVIARCLGIEHVLSYIDPKRSVTIITSVAGLARGRNVDLASAGL
jgi:hypothetical protein